VRALIAKMHVVCVREKSHLLIGGGYVASTVWHSSALMAAVYGLAALLATHVVHRTKSADAELRHQPKHLAR
jgi:hypothetical protein